MNDVLSTCTGMGLLDRAFLDAGFNIMPGCEIDPEMREMYAHLCGGKILTRRFSELIRKVEDKFFSGVIGGPPCQSKTQLKSMRKPKFPDLTPEVNRLLKAVNYDWFLFENVAPIEIPGAKHILMNAMHYYQPHQSRERWFTYSENLTPPEPAYQGDVNELMAYSVVAGRIYGPIRGARLQGYPQAAGIPVKCVKLQKGLANAVPYPMALAWAESIKLLCAKRNKKPHAVNDDNYFLAS